MDKRHIWHSMCLPTYYARIGRAGICAGIPGNQYSYRDLGLADLDGRFTIDINGFERDKMRPAALPGRSR
jgi:hypothetical protein